MYFFKENQSDKRASEGGFTLIEMAIVMLVISFMASGLVIGIPQYINNKKTELTRQKMDLVSNALSAYAQRHYRLPCPAVTNATADRGMERDAGNCFAENDDETELYVNAEGALPWRELGLSEQDVIDGWGRYITYKPAPHLTVNTYSQLMQEDNQGADGMAQTPDIHNACRSQVWYNEGRHHLNRQKALFCCNSHPKPDYLTSVGAIKNDIDDLPGWKDNAITVTGVDDNDDTSDDNVVSTNAWIDNYRAKDADPVNPNYYAAGTFDDVYDEDADAPLIRASGHAVTLISHGGNGAFSFLRGQPETTRLDATVDPVDGVTDVTIAEAATADERKNIWPPQIFAATLGTSKSAAHDKSGLRQGVSDDVVEFMRSDQLFSKAGHGSTCVRPTGGDYTCPAFSYSNYVYVLDTSKSMNAEGLGDTRYNVSLKTLKNTDNPEDPIDATDSLLAQHIISEGKNDDDPDMIGFTGLAYATKTEAESKFQDEWQELVDQSNALKNTYYGVVGQTCTTKKLYEETGDLICKTVNVTKTVDNPNCGPADEGCPATIKIVIGTKEKCTKEKVVVGAGGPGSRFLAG